MRENATVKAARLAASGRVYCQQVDENTVNAWVRGDSAEVHRVRWDGDRWSCTCPALTTECSHVRAVQLVTVVRGGALSNPMLMLESAPRPSWA